MFLTLALLGCQGSENIVQQVYPDLVVLPGELAFGDVAVQYSVEGSVQIVNGGPAGLEIDEVRVESDVGDVFALVGSEAPLTLATDEATTLDVRFLPQTYLDYTGTLVIVSNDEEYPEKTIPLTGRGVDAPTPDIEITPASVDFGTVPVGLDVWQTLVVANVGGGSLNLGTVTAAGSGAFAVMSGDVSGYVIPEGQAQSVLLRYQPTVDTGDHGTLTFPSDDPDEPSVAVQLLGNGGGDYDFPVAVIDCPGVVEPRDTITLDGSASYDPEDPDGEHPLTYAWTLVGVPDGSAVTGLVNDTTDTTYLETDVAGAYVVQLQVTNSIDLSSVPAVCVLEAVPTEAIHVELMWDTSAADLDLHLVRDDGEFYIEHDDCNWCDKRPEWGDVLSDEDDPSLDIDDRSGFGPENINIPTPVAGTYHPYVHYYESNGDDAVVATVKVYLDGALFTQISQTLYRNDLWRVGTINWPDATFGKIDTVEDDAPRRGCTPPAAPDTGG